MVNRNFLIALLSLAALAVHAQPEPHVAIDGARAAARENRNREAAELFGRAIIAAPQLRRELLREWADQLLYSERSREAIPLYQEVLQAPRDRDERLGATKGLGLAYLWTDQPGRARLLFEELASEQSQDEDISRNLGRALSWGGRQREAERHLAEHIQRHPQDGEAHVQLAQAQAWMGRPDEALATLQGVEREDARKLRARVELDISPRSLFDAQRSTQSDGLNILAGRVGQSISFAQGRGTVAARLEHYAYDSGDGKDSVRVTRPIVAGRWRFSDSVEWNGEVGRERIAPRGSDVLEFTPYSTWVTWWPNDAFRFDLSSGRSDFDNLKSLRLGISHRDTGLSMDYTPTERSRLTARLQRSDILDGNRRDMAQLEGEWRLRTRPDVFVGARYTHFEHARQLDNGYFSPLRFYSLLATVRGTWRPLADDSRWEVTSAAAWGREHSIPEGGKPVYDLSLQAAYQIDPANRLEFRAQRFSSRTAASTGFARSIIGLTLTRSW